MKMIISGANEITHGLSSGRCAGVALYLRLGRG